MRQYLASKTLNSWKVIVGHKPYIITPAHNVMYKKNNKFIKSHFVTNCDHNWQISQRYLESFSSEFDLAWTPLKLDNNFNTLNKLNGVLIQDKLNSDLYNANFYFLQPYHHLGKLKPNTHEASLGAMSGIIYQSPNSTLYEAINVGFRGMSGAICVNPNNVGSYIGMFVRLGKNLGSDPNASTLDFSETKESKRGLIMLNEQIEKLILEKKHEVCINDIVTI